MRRCKRSLLVLADIHQAYSEEEISTNVAFGYLAVLLSYVCVNKSARAYACSQLQGGTLDQLLRAMKEFLQYHNSIDQEIYDSGGDVDVTAGFTSRLQRLVDKLEDE